jgi:hypothetical protein
MEILIEYFASLWEGLFNTPFQELVIPQIWIAVIISLGFVAAVKVIFKSAKTGGRVVFEGAKSSLKVFSPKHRASKHVCLHCGRTLDKCVCPTNKDVSYSKRIKKHKLEVKALKAAKQARAVK